MLATAKDPLAQTASEITPPTFEPPPQRLTGSLVFSGEPGLNAPPGSESLSVTISGVDIEGELPGMLEAGEAVRNRLTSGPVRVSEIFEAAASLEAAYVEGGFILARVVLPAQQLDDGDRLRLVVVDGYVESIDTTAVPERVRERIETLTEALIGERGLQQSELERRLLLAGDTYGVALVSALSSGTNPGGTVIILQPQYRRTTGFVGFDNLQSDALGDYTFNAGLELNGALGFGEALYLRGSANHEDVFEDNPRNRTIAVGGIVPVGRDGLSLGFEYTNSKTAPDGLTRTTSTFDRLSFRGFYPLVRRRDVNVTLRASLDLQEDSQAALADGGAEIPVFLDQTSVLRLSSDAAWFGERGTVFDLGGTVSFGIDAFGARTASDANQTSTQLSRDGADAEFAKLELNASLRRALGSAFAINLSTRAQLSFGDALLTSEQFGISSFDSVSAFDSGVVSGDSGWFVRGEVSRPTDLDFGDTPVGLTPYLFAATGMVNREVPSVGEAGSVRATAYGLGVDILLVRDAAFSNASLRLELANGKRDDGGDDEVRFSIFGALRF